MTVNSTPKGSDLELDALEKASLRPAPGYEGLYAVTADGRVWAYPSGTRGGRWLKHSASPYPRVLITKDGESRTRPVHRLVAEAWIPNPLNKPQVNHINGQKGDPRVENLEWVTPAENVRHAWATGLARVSERMRERKSHCQRGHPMDNAIVREDGRACRECQVIRNRAWRERVGYRAPPKRRPQGDSHA